MQFTQDQKSAIRHKLVLAARDDKSDFDETILKDFKAESFDVSYLPLANVESQHESIEALRRLAGELGDGENFAIVAYGEAASVFLEIDLKSMEKLCALVLYYPDNFSSLGNGFPPHFNVLVHFAESLDFTPSCRYYVYPDVKEGFAATNVKAFDKVAASLAWSRTLATLRKAFEVEVDLEKVWEEHVALEFVTKDVDATMATMVAEPYVNHIPTLTGGIGYKDLHRFYRDYFIPGNPPSLKMRLLSRTVGTDRVVDEMHLSFKHTQVMPWLLPDVEPTKKDVEVALVVIVCIRGGKLYHEHIYWDQASVLVQIGLLDPKSLLSKNVQGRLPVVDGAGARKVVDESSIRSNELISSW